MRTCADKDVSLGDLEAVLAVSECGQFNRAGEVLGRPQPSVSRAVQDVESSVETALFDRGARPVALTPGSEDFFYELRKGLYYVHRAFGRLRRNRRAADAVVEVGHSSYFDVELLAYLTHVAKASDAGVSTVYHSSFTSEIVANVLGGVWDCGFVLKPAITYDLATIPIMRDRLGVVMASGHSLARQRLVCLRDFEHEPLILPMRQRNPAFREWFLQRCAAAGFHPRIVQEISHPHEAIVFAEKRIGVALATRATAKCPEKDGIVFRPFAEKSLAVEIEMVLRADATSDVLRSYVALVMKMRERIDRRPRAENASFAMPEST
jgi:DNA-binding transcriptional LysR family regulator